MFDGPIHGAVQCSAVQVTVLVRPRASITQDFQGQVGLLFGYFRGVSPEVYIKN
jgi:hypothetical protein